MDYSDWNFALGSWFFQASRSQEIVWLSVEPAVLLDAARRIGATFESEDEAEEDFLRAARDRLGRFRWTWSGGSLRGYPPYLGLLALQVLAAYHMHGDREEWTSNAYWPRLRMLLGQDASGTGGRLPEGLTREQHLSMWNAAFEWAQVTMRGEYGVLRLPAAEGHYHKKLPISQVLLRRGDLQQLHRFYRDVGLRPGEAVSAGQIADLLPGRSYLFSRHAQRALEEKDVSLPAICQQIAQHLADWDGHTPELRRVSSGPVLRLWLSVSRGDLRGGLLTRDREGWARLPGISLTDILSGRGPADFRPLQPDRFLLVWDPVEHYHIEDRAARPGDRVLLLSRGQESFDIPCRRHSCPSGWHLVEWSVPLEPPYGPFVRADRRRLAPIGGLRLRRRVWMAGAAPRVRVIGARVDSLKASLGATTWLVPVNAEQVAELRGLETSGRLRLWVPGEKQFALSITLQASRRWPGQESRLGWVPETGGWPRELSLDGQETALRGCELIGTWHRPPQDEQEEWPPASTALVSLLTGRAGSELERHPHPTVRALAHGLGPLS